MVKVKTTEDLLEKQLWKAADKLKKNIDAAEYKHIVLRNLEALRDTRWLPKLMNGEVRVQYEENQSMETA